MRVRQLAFLALLGLTGISCVAYSQGGYGDTRRDDPRYDDPRAGDQRYGDQRYDDQRYGDYDNERSIPRSQVGFFYDELSPYGEWVNHPEYGWAWFPRHVDPYWRPYSLGRWALSEYGWTWVSDEPFGWATYHYGRWAFDPEVGWLWVPGTEWGPAWVAWQHGSGYIGWAPLPPSVGFQAGFGLRLGGLDLRVVLEPQAYAFVEERMFLEPRVYRYSEPRARNITLIQDTRDITNYTFSNDRIVDNGVPIERIEQATGHRVPRMRVVTAPSGGSYGVRGDEIHTYRPPPSRLETVRVPREPRSPRPSAPLTRDPSPPTPATPATPPDRYNRRPMPPSAVNDRPGQPGQPPSLPVVDVAPWARPQPAENLERRQQQEQAALRANAAAEQKRLAQLQQRESKRPATVNAQELAQRHAAEVKAQQELTQRAERQLQTRQQIERKAAQATPPSDRKPAKPPNKRDKSKGEDKEPEMPPPPPPPAA